jgi:hypothetical protein
VLPWWVWVFIRTGVGQAVGCSGRQRAAADFERDPCSHAGQSCSALLCTWGGGGKGALGPPWMWGCVRAPGAAVNVAPVVLCRTVALPRTSPTRSPRRSQLPWYALVAFGSYSLWCIGFNLFNFRDCPEASVELAKVRCWTAPPGLHTLARPRHGLLGGLAVCGTHERGGWCPAAHTIVCTADGARWAGHPCTSGVGRGGGGGVELLSHKHCECYQDRRVLNGCTPVLCGGRGLCGLGWLRLWRQEILEARADLAKRFGYSFDKK